MNRGPVGDKVSEEVADEDDDDDNPSRYGAIFQHIKGQEVAIAKDKELSFVLEYLLKLTGVEGTGQGPMGCVLQRDLGS